MSTWKSIILLASVVLFSATSAMANPALLPKHPGHPMAPGVDPVTGQPLTHDTGQQANPKDAALQEAAGHHDRESVQNLASDATIESQGAGRLPKIHGYPNYKIEPPVTEAIDPSKFSSAGLKGNP